MFDIAHNERPGTKFGTLARRMLTTIAATAVTMAVVGAPSANADDTTSTSPTESRTVASPAARTTASPWAFPAKAAPAAKPRSITVVTFNVGNARNERVEADLTKLMSAKPDVIGLQEVSDRDTVIRTAAKAKGYRVYQSNYRGAPRASDHNAFLVRADVPVIGEGMSLRPMHNATWVGHNTAGAKRTGTTAPKYINTLRVLVDGRGWVIGNVHLVPSAERRGNDQTRKLHQTETQAIAQWWNQRWYEPIVIGDFNATPDSPLLAGLNKLATPNAKPSHGKRAIDIVYTKKTASVKVSALDGYHSDHRPVIATITSIK